MLVKLEILGDEHSADAHKICFVNPRHVQYLRYIMKHNSPNPNWLDKEYTAVIMEDGFGIYVEKPIGEVAEMLGVQNA